MFISLDITFNIHLSIMYKKKKGGNIN